MNTAIPAAAGTTATTVTQALQAAQAQGLDRLDAQLLLLHALGRDANDRAWLLAHDRDELAPQDAARFAQLCQRRLAGEPVAYIRGEREFHGLVLKVDARVLDPRPDTETLVDWALELLPHQSALRVLDLGTGSGAIALSLAHARPQALVTAADLSADALAVAQANGARLGLNVRWLQGSWFAPLADIGQSLQSPTPFGLSLSKSLIGKEMPFDKLRANGLGETFDLIVSNPPYIREDDVHMKALTHEPRMALTSGASGLDDIVRIVASAAAHMTPGAWLLIEHGHDQAADVAALMVSQGFAHVQHRHDLAGIARCTGGQRP